MIDILNVNKRKYNEEVNSYPHNLSLLERSARCGNISNMEECLKLWNCFYSNETLSLNHTLDIVKECLSHNNEEYIRNKISFIIENNLIPQIYKKDSYMSINKFSLDCGLPNLSIMSKCNEMITYDRILKNQSILESNLDVLSYDDIEECVMDICEIYNNSSLSSKEKYALSIENSLYTKNILSNKIIISESNEDIINLVDLFFALNCNDQFEYDEINPICVVNEDDINSFSYSVVNGMMSGMYINGGWTIDQMISRLPHGELKKYEKANKLHSLDVIDLEMSKSINAYINNESYNSYRNEFVKKKIDEKTYNCIAFYENSNLTKLSILYKKGENLVIVPIYSKFGQSQPVIIERGVAGNLYEETNNLIYLDEKKLMKKIKKDIKSIDFKKIKSLNELKKKIDAMCTKFFTKKDTSILDEVPGVFTCVRGSCIAGAFALHPMFGAVTYMTNKFMKIHFERKQRDKVLKKYNDEIKKVESKISKCKSEKTKKNYEKYLKELKENKSTLEEYYEKFFNDDELYNNDDDDFSFDESAEVLNELSVVNTLKLGKEKFKKSFVKMSDKEKRLSSQMDNAYDRFVYQVEKNLSNRNREAVIKGSLIPSFSAMMKLAITAGTVAFISPTLSVITVMGGIAASKNATMKERKYILNEIDIQLDIVEKKLQLAENNNDMKTYEQLLRLKRQLESEKNRIIYKRKRSIVATKYN